MKDIRNYEGIYAITEDGKVWSYKNKKFLKPYINNCGYLAVLLSKSCKHTCFSVHKLVAETFIPNLDNKLQVNHKDENKLNNSVDNLEWVTAKENVNYGSRNKKISKALSKPVICVETGIIYQSFNDVNKQLNILKTSLCNCLKGYSKTAGGYHWKYMEEN